MKIRKIIIFLLISTLSFALDMTSDSIHTSPMKFRGSVYIGGSFYPGHHLHHAHNNIANFDDSIKDYRDAADPTNAHHAVGDPGRVLGDGAFRTHGLEGKIFVDYAMIAPFLASNNFLFQDSSIALRLLGELSPVTALAGVQVSWTPIPIFVLSGGVKLGMAWNLPVGIGFARNNYGKVMANEPQRVLTEDSLYGPMVISWINVLFQFDLAAVMPKAYQRWTHIVMQAKPELMHRSMANLSDSIPYYWENDEGENYNGWIFNFDSLLGYRFIFNEDSRKAEQAHMRHVGARAHNDFNMILAISAQIDRMKITNNQLSPIAKNGWGSDFALTMWGPMVFMELPHNFFVMTYAAWANGRKYTSQTVGNADFSKREYEDYYVYFRKITLAFGWTY